MFDSRVLETAIGVVFMYLGIALVVTAVQEALASLAGLRARTLQEGLKAMLTSGDKGVQFYNKIMGHPIVSSANRNPSYVSAQQFSTAVIDTLTGGGVPTALASLRTTVQNLADGPYKSILSSLFRDGETTIDAFEQRLQNWFDQAMDRVSGIYKRKSQVISFAIGTAIALLFGADTLGMTKALWIEPALLAQTVSGATKVAGEKGMPTAQAVLTQFDFSPVWDKGWWALLGCFITAFAVSLGAPFWFDLLQSFVNVRGAGPVPDKSPPAGPRS